LFLGPQNIKSISFRAKMAILNFDKNYWPVGLRGVFLQILTDFFFPKEFCIYFFFLSFIYAIDKFPCKNTDIVFRSKFLTSRTKGHFRTNFTRVILFFFPFEFLVCSLDLWIFNLQVFVQKWQHCISVKILCQSVLGAFSYKF